MLSPKPWLPEHVLRLLLYVFAAMALLSILAEAGGFAAPADEGKKWALFILATLSVHLVTVALVYRFLREQNATWSDGFGLGHSPARAVKIGAIATFAIIPLALLLNSLSMLIFQSFQEEVTLQPAVQVLEKASDWRQQLAFAAMAVLTAPVIEEIVFRGMVYPVVKQQGFPRIALWSSALFFAAIHAHAMTFLPLTFLGLCLVMLYELTDNLLAPITAHAVFNGANFAWLVMT